MGPKAFVLFLISFLRGASLGAPSQCKKWAHFGRSTYLSLFDDPCHTSWRSKSKYVGLDTKVLQVPKGVPFGAYCGSCYGFNAKEDFNISFELSSHRFESFPMSFGQSKESEFAFQSKYECAMAYLLTEPISKNDVIKCHLRRSYRPMKDAVKLKIVQPVINVTHEIIVHEGSGPINMFCPTESVKGERRERDFTFIWYSLESDSRPHDVFLVGTRKFLQIHPKHSKLNISCFSYVRNNPKFVLRKDFVVFTYPLNQTISSIPDGLIVRKMQDDQEELHRNPLLIVFTMLAGLACVILTIVVVYHCWRRGAQRPIPT